VYLDLRHLGEQLIEAKLPMVRELCLQYERIDPVTELIPVRPVVHYMMGGVHTDIDGKAGLDGLYAAGETACVSINGANRLGSNSLPECLVFGARAGRAAAEYAATAPAPPAVIAAQVADETRRLDELMARDSRRDDGTAKIRDELQATMEDAAGIYRTGPSMEKGLDTFEALRERVAAIGIRDTSRSFNTELVGALELENLVDIGECILRSGLAREESRGAHQRTDFTSRDDDRFLVHHTVRRGEDGTAQLEKLPVTITRFSPGERVYGR
jgi:fumarate reductase flavoprotein subunit